MLLNNLERALMNNPLRGACQRHYEASQLLALGGPLETGSSALEIGCGRGVGAELILDRFGAGRVDAFDLDPRMVALASRRLRSRGDRVTLRTGNATCLAVDDASYDAVFDFGIIHHVPRWRVALTEIHRVLKPGGRFYGEEVYRRFLQWPMVDRLLEHPRSDRFDSGTFLGELSAAGFESVDHREIGDLFGWFVAFKPT